MKKKFLLSLMLFLICSYTKAAIHTVQVTNFQFSPDNITDVFVGDVIHFVWVMGNHTTTDDPATQGAENALPAGAASWNSVMDESHPTFDYTVTVAGLYKYYCIPHKDFGMIGQFTAGVVTPVKLASFLIQGSSEKATLMWKTLSEENVDYFSVRRSVNGLQYAEIAQVKATGSSQVENSYSFSDTKVSVNQKYYYYYIATVDKDGKEMLSETKLFKNSDAIRKLILSISPNPVSSAGHLMMTFNAEKEGKMDVKVINTEGKIVLKTIMQAYSGVNRGHVHLANVHAGAYTLVCTLDGIKESYKVVIQ